ncbi:hypothetical protein ACJ73_03560 [Blastomyces percursus]|uniref:DNA/RNA-binding domain-containing protein n=1 Tax=Blastomyces percursus TaxID=1658174 RepID=A0A1J9RAQ3_9EURO|nr:hypothetical protein ACJ73_03560 [Blastomyces percursus]
MDLPRNINVVVPELSDHSTQDTINQHRLENLNMKNLSLAPQTTATSQANLRKQPAAVEESGGLDSPQSQPEGTFRGYSTGRSNGTFASNTSQPPHHTNSPLTNPGFLDAYQPRAGSIEGDDPSRPPTSPMLRQPETRPISEQQLINEVGNIYASLVMVEMKCVKVVQQQFQSKKVPTKDQWQALIGLHKTLLHDHHDFFLASQHPSASPALRQLASEYGMPARMWRHGIHSFLELMRHHLPDCLDHMLEFIYTAYSMVALLMESVPAFEETWIECLGDLARYRMAVESDLRDREIWAGVTQYWYHKAADKSPLHRWIDDVDKEFTLTSADIDLRTLFWFMFSAPVDFPIMPCLKRLVLKNRALSSPIIKTLTGQKFPALKELCLDALDILDMSSFLPSIPGPDELHGFPTIERLTITRCLIPDIPRLVEYWGHNACSVVLDFRFYLQQKDINICLPSTKELVLSGSFPRDIRYMTGARHITITPYNHEWNSSTCRNNLIDITGARFFTFNGVQWQTTWNSQLQCGQRLQYLSLKNVIVPVSLWTSLITIQSLFHVKIGVASVDAGYDSVVLTKFFVKFLSRGALSRYTPGIMLFLQMHGEVA